MEVWDKKYGTFRACVRLRSFGLLTAEQAGGACHGGNELAPICPMRNVTFLGIHSSVFYMQTRCLVKKYNKELLASNRSGRYP
jgi:hypothetical protein